VVGESSQKAIKLDGVLWDELDRWLQTPKAKKLGFHSKAQFATQAIRELLEDYTVSNRKTEDEGINARLDLIYKMLAVVAKHTVGNDFESILKKQEQEHIIDVEYYKSLHRYLPGEKPITTHRVVKSKSNPDLPV